jgi:hypothetical protein
MHERIILNIWPMPTVARTPTLEFQVCKDHILINIVNILSIDVLVDFRFSWHFCCSWLVQRRFLEYITNSTVFFARNGCFEEIRYTKNSILDLATDVSVPKNNCGVSITTETIRLCMNLRPLKNFRYIKHYLANTDLRHRLQPKPSNNPICTRFLFWCIFKNLCPHRLFVAPCSVAYLEKPNLKIFYALETINIFLWFWSE